MSERDEGAATELVSFRMSEALREYTYRLVELGAVEGPVGAMELHPDVAALMHAIHHVMAGGKVDVTVAEAGEASVVEELDRRLQSV